MRSGCLARAINRSLLTEFAAVRGFKVRNFVSAKSLPEGALTKMRIEIEMRPVACQRAERFWTAPVPLALSRSPQPHHVPWLFAF